MSRLVRFAFLATLAPLTISTSLRPSPQQSRELTGNWQLWRRPLTGVNSNFPNAFRISVARVGDSLVASATNGFRVTARASGDSVIWRGTLANGTPTQLLTKWSGDSLVGSTTAAGVETAVWLVRDPVRPAGAPWHHMFKPTSFSNYFTGTIPPVLRIHSGDTVQTETIDAGGRDSTRTVRARGGNPLTGPFWINGSLPGDVIAVHFIRIRTNRTTAGSGSELSWTAVDPDYITDYKEAADSGSNWIIDAKAGVARLDRTTGGIAGFTVPLKPMLGCVGVAPGPTNRPETRATSYPGTWGGNLDYNRLAEGATVYLPVAVAGAFLFVGDGHAAQGDGELTGSGLETSMNVEFSVELIRSKQLGFPRIEDANDIMSVGVGGSLDDAFKFATTGLAQWLETEYKLTRSEAAMILGAAAQLDIGEVVDRDYSVVARFPKRLLLQLKR